MRTNVRRFPKVTFNSPVVLTFVLACIVVQVMSTLTGGASTDALFTFHTTTLSHPLAYPTLITFALGHISWEHIFGNMGYILLLGPLLEEKYGSGRLAGIMLASALATSLASIVIFHTGGVGASGVVFTFILLSSVTQLREGEVPLTLVIVAALYFGEQIYGAIFVRAFISYHGHIVGGIVGAVAGFLLSDTSRERPSDGIF